MQTSVSLYGPFLFNPFLLWLLILIFLIILLVIVLLSWKRNKKKVVVKKIPKDEINELKNKYDRMILELQDKVKASKISNRDAYYELSKILRNFIFEVTGIDVTKVSLMEAKYYNMPMLYMLMEEYYIPEFAFFFYGNILNSIDKTRKVILEWK